MENEEAIKAISDALRDVFGEGKERQRFIDISRIPLICQTILQIGDDIKDLKVSLVHKDEFRPVQLITYGIVGLVLTAVLGALLMLVIRQNGV